MKKKKSILSVALLLLSFAIILTDCSVLSFSDTSKVKTCHACTDITDHFENSHSQGTEDNLTFIERTFRISHINLQNTFGFYSDLNLNDNFVSEIWQPPKVG